MRYIHTYVRIYTVLYILRQYFRGKVLLCGHIPILRLDFLLIASLLLHAWHHITSSLIQYAIQPERERDFIFYCSTWLMMMTRCRQTLAMDLKLRHQPVPACLPLVVCHNLADPFPPAFTSGNDDDRHHPKRSRS